MNDNHGSNGNGTTRKAPNAPPAAAPNGAEISAGQGSAGGASGAANGSAANGVTGAIEYYILCPQRATEVPGLITHLISRDICEKRQSEHYHKCPNCVRSRVWRERNGLPVEEHAAVAHGS